MKKEVFKFKSARKDVDIRAVRYLPENEPTAILQISHGMCEFIDRYEKFAEFLCSKGFLVTGNDHLGHGGSINSEDDFGYFGENGSDLVLSDLYELTKITKKDYPNLPYFLLGHSMGSFYARRYIAEYGNELNGAIIMGTGYQDNLTLGLGMFLCKFIAFFKGDHYRSDLINNIAFSSYNKKFENRTSVDWLTKDHEITDWYLNEGKCTFKFTLNGFYNLFYTIKKLHDKKYIGNTPKELPVLFVSGEDDPVGNYGKDVKISYETLKEVGVRNIEIKLYPNDRHEILNETDRLDVYNDIYNWLSRTLKVR